MYSTSQGSGSSVTGIVIFLVLFLTFFLPWCWYTGRSIRAVLTYKKTTGTIQNESYVTPDANPTAIAQQRSARIGTYTHSAIFKTERGESYQTFTRVRSNPPPFQIGDTVRIYYPEKNPSRAILGTFSELWFPSLALGFLSLIFLVLLLGTWLGPPPVLPRT